MIGQLETHHVTASKFQYKPGSLLLKQTRATDLPLELANQFDMRKQNKGAKVLLRNIFFR